MNQLEGEALDEAVAKAEGIDRPYSLRYSQTHRNIKMRGGLLIGAFTREEAIEREKNGFERYMFRRYSTEWKHGGPIIERELIEIHARRYLDRTLKEWAAFAMDWPNGLYSISTEGPTPLIAAMRAFVASRSAK